MPGGCEAVGQVWGPCEFGSVDPTNDDLDETNTRGGGIEDDPDDTIVAGDDPAAVACGCDPNGDTCGRGQVCHVGGCTNPTRNKWGYCKSVGGICDPEIPDLRRSA